MGKEKKSSYIIDSNLYREIGKEDNRKELIEYMERYQYYSASTIKKYFYAIREFLLFLNKNEICVYYVGHKEVSKYIIKLSLVSKKVNSYNYKIKIIYQFYNILIVTEKIKENPVKPRLHYVRDRKGPPTPPKKWM